MYTGLFRENVHTQGLSPHTCLPSAKLNAYSRALHTTHTATPFLVSPSGWTASARPAKLAPKAGEIFDVRSFVALGCRLRNVRALGRSRFDRNVVKKRERSRWRKTRRAREAAVRAAGDRNRRCSGRETLLNDELIVSNSWVVVVTGNSRYALPLL